MEEDGTNSIKNECVEAEDQQMAKDEDSLDDQVQMGFVDCYDI